MNATQRDLSMMQDAIDDINQEGQEQQPDINDELELDEIEPEQPIPLEDETLLEEEEATTRTPKKKPRISEEKRSRELSLEKRLLQEEINRLAQENYDRDRVIQEQRQLLEERDKRSFQLEEDTLKSQITNAQKEWQKAFDEGDSEKLAEASTRLSYYTSQLVQTKNNREEYEHYAPYAQQKSPEPIPPKSQKQYTSQVQDWIEDNSWYDTNSEDFNPSLRKSVDEYASTVLNHYFAPDDPRYVQYLNDYISGQTNQSPTRSPQRQPQMRKSTQMVAPVNRGPVNSGARPDPIQKIMDNMPPNEKEMARAMIYETPGLTDQQKDRKYAEGKYKMLVRQKQQRDAQSFQGGFNL